jgi:hypothetical protein
LEIQINDQSLDFTVEDNDTLGDVVQDLEDWLRGSALVLCSVKHQDQELLSRPTQEWAAIPHHQVGTLAVTVRHARELGLLNLQTVLEFLDLLAKAVSAGNPEALAGLLTGLPAMAESIRKHFETTVPAVSGLTALFGKVSPAEAAGWPEAQRTRALSLIDEAAALVRSRLREFEDPRGALRDLAQALRGCIEEISDVSILLQTGRDRQAMEALVRFSELSQSLVRLVAAAFAGGQDQEPVIGGMGLQQFYGELNGILREVVEAFHARDSVLIGDLMEYEVAPRLEKMRSFLQELP